MQEKMEVTKEMDLVCFSCNEKLIHKDTTSTSGQGSPVIKEHFECSGCWKDYDIYTRGGQLLSVHIPITGRA